jgi:hypothetical protein
MTHSPHFVTNAACKNKNQVWKKFAHYQIEVDDKQDDKAVEILLCSFARPHMRCVFESE